MQINKLQNLLTIYYTIIVLKQRSKIFFQIRNNKDTKKWVAQITLNKKNISLGYFKTKEEAAKAYNESAKRYRGNLAKLNQIGGELNGN